MSTDQGPRRPGSERPAAGRGGAPEPAPAAVLEDAVPTQAHQRLPVLAGDRICRQVEAIDAWHAARRACEGRLAATCASRRERESANRELDVLRRTQQAIVARTADELARPVAPMVFWTPTAVIAHRHAWFAGRLAERLEERGVTVLESTQNGADALAVVVVEQPDLVVSGDRLAMMSGEALLVEAGRFAPLTMRAVQVGDPQEAAAWHAVAEAVFPHRHPPVAVADALVEIAFPSRGGRPRA